MTVDTKSVSFGEPVTGLRARSIVSGVFFCGKFPGAAVEVQAQFLWPEFSFGEDELFGTDTPLPLRGKTVFSDHSRSHVPSSRLIGAKPLNTRMKQLSLIFSFTFLLTHDASAATKIPVKDVSLFAKSLPEFKEDPWNRESEGNQISGVVRVFFQDSREHFWFGGERGLQRYDGTALVVYDIRDEFDKGHTVKAIAEDRDGNIWVAATNGLFKYDGTYFTRFSVEDGLNSNDVWDVLVDSSGSIWVATFDGACRIDGDTFTPISLPAATERDYTKGVWGPNVVWSITEDRAGKLWFIAESGVYMYDTETLSEVSATELGPLGNVSGVLGDKNGRIWFATRDGLVLFDEGTFTNITQREGLGDTGVGALCEDSSGNIWFTAGNSGVYRYDGSSFTKFSTEDGLGALVYCIAEDSEERMWFVGRRGAYRYDQQSFVNITRDGPW